MAHIRTETIINTGPARVWQKLLKFEDYPVWNPLITKVKGQPFLGATLTISLAGPLDTSFDLDVKITQADENKELHWVGSFPIMNFLMTGDHYFILEDLGNGSTKLIHGEQFSGLMAPFLASLIEGQATPLYQALCDSLKAECESGV